MSTHEPSLLRRIELASGAIDRQLEQDLAQEGVSLLEAHSLLVVAELERMPLADLRRALGRQGSTMTGLLDRLVAKELLARVARQGDRRAWDVTVTDEGRRIARALRRRIAVLEARIAARLGPEAHKALVAGLQVVAAEAADVARR
jgi:DNA-binding MarR family transcriptional regulator